MMLDHLPDHKMQELFAELRIKVCGIRQRSEPVDLLLLPAGVRRRKIMLSFIKADLLGDLEPLSKHENKGCIDIVDALAVGAQLGLVIIAGQRRVLQF